MYTEVNPCFSCSSVEYSTSSFHFIFHVTLGIRTSVNVSFFLSFLLHSSSPDDLGFPLPADITSSLSHHSFILHQFSPTFNSTQFSLFPVALLYVLLYDRLKSLLGLSLIEKVVNER
ncbi:hypothetical protein AB6A40_006083 [Gnathostoma spinigerum]|uniref:Uncharacterized protein n=1 Tax=Gnathostoma spinigerum TaxID=75299 RepID=A0ABD6EMJ7_9BILA